MVVLCRPSEPGNVGAVCRVMKNMGLSQLYLVAPEPLDRAVLLTRAIHADDVWRSARTFGSLGEAVAGCSFVVGTTCRRGRKRKVSMRPRDLVAWLSERVGAGAQTLAFAPVALVFGNERTGLDADEINCCNLASHIPVSDEFPSLNLSHAVQVYAYEFYLAFGGTEGLHVKGEWVPLERRAVDGLTAEISEILKGLGFYKYPGREEQTRFLRDLICRAGLTEREGRYLKGIFDKAARLGSMKGGSP